jgi:hypothetical protein
MYSFFVSSETEKPWIKVRPLDPQLEPKNLASLKVEVGRRWNQLYLLDILKEGDLRIGFTPLFKSPTPFEILPREILQKRIKPPLSFNNSKISTENPRILFH